MNYSFASNTKNVISLNRSSMRVIPFITYCLLFLFLGTTAAIAQDNKRVTRRTVTLGAQNQKSLYGGFADLLTGKVYSLADVRPNQADIDLVYAYGSSTSYNLMLPSSAGLRSFGASYRAQVADAWTQRNRGTLVALENNKENRKLFRSVKNNKQLLDAYDQAVKEVNSRPGYSRTLHGPSARIQKLNIGDYFVLRSRDRNVYAIGRIVDVKEGYQGYVTLDVKVINK